METSSADIGSSQAGVPLAEITDTLPACRSSSRNDTRYQYFGQFISNNEPVFLYKIYNLCQKHLINDKLKEYLIKSREAWKQAQKSTGIILKYNERELTPEYITDLWINGYYFHSDINKLHILNHLLAEG